MRKEARRQFIHFLFGSLFISMAAVSGVQFTLLVLSAVFLAGLIASRLVKHGLRMPLISHVVERVERKQEQGLPGKGALMFFLGAIVLMLLSRNILVVVGALCIAVYGDAASTIFGLKLGKHRIAGKKTLEGTLGGILVSIIFLGVLFEWWVALAASLAGMLAELLPLDDNFTTPIVAAAALTVLL